MTGTVGNHGRSHARLAPLGVAAGAVAGCAALSLADPQDGGYPLCPFLALTGRWCPACGSLRALGRLVRLDVAAAASFNVLLVLALPYLLYRYVAWSGRSLGWWSLPPLDPPPAVTRGLLVVLAVFGVARNVPVDALVWLAPV